MSALFTRRHTALALTVLAGLAAAEPAFAQSTGVGGNIGSFIENIISLLNSSVIRGLAVIAVILTGIAWMFGHLDMRRAGSVFWVARGLLRPAPRPGMAPRAKASRRCLRVVA